MIYFECYSDEAFLLGIGLTSRRLEHSFNKGEVCNSLKRSQNCVGLVDEDPTESQPHYIQDLIKRGRTVYQDSYLLLIHDTAQNNRLVIIRPDIESFAIKLAKDLSINIESAPYKLPSTAKKLHQVLSFSKNKLKLSSLHNFFKDCSHHPSIVKIKEFIKEK